MESKNKLYRFRVLDITWDLTDMKEEGETYFDVVKRRNLPSETEVEFVHNNNPTNAEIVDAISEVLCDMYHFCALAFYKELIEKDEVPQYDAADDNYILVVCLEDAEALYTYLFHKKESAIQNVLDRIKDDDIREEARESLDNLMQWHDIENEITYNIEWAKFED